MLFIGNEKAMFVGSNLTTHESMNIEFELGETGVRWIGRTLFRKGGVSWLQIDFRDKKHFFSAETGITNLGSKAKTRALFEECCRASKSASVTSSHAPM
ncbi:MAG TPA: hypothetical protein HPP83_05895 [Candidatus Hydrogenedentes bacterium]|nr:hypothetical protein [Candidatus Hydrogenedentota bacterium]